ncbi:MAG: hypothetical protein RQ750_17075 [Roseovarius sp.]|nr:hypothetical protein [Roseovarius sp.]
MADKPIILNAPMIRALLDGRKTQTRLIHKEYRDYSASALLPDGTARPICTRFAPGNRLWVREAFRGDADYDNYAPSEWSHWPVHYEADGPPDTRRGLGSDGKKRPSIHMPRWASRLTLIVTDVRVQRLQDISGADAVAEGGPSSHPSIDRVSREFGAKDFPRSWFEQTWNSIHGPCAWDDNPWVVALSFDVHRCNIDQMGPN